MRLSESTKPYPLPYNMREVIEKEVRDMLKLGVIEPTQSPYSSPLHLVKEKRWDVQTGGRFSTSQQSDGLR